MAVPFASSLGASDLDTLLVAAAVALGFGFFAQVVVVGRRALPTHWAAAGAKVVPPEAGAGRDADVPAGDASGDHAGDDDDDVQFERHFCGYSAAWVAEVAACAVVMGDESAASRFGVTRQLVERAMSTRMHTSSDVGRWRGIAMLDQHEVLGSAW